MTDDRLTPEERAVIEAAVRNLGQYVGTDLRDAVAAYREATAPPEPFEAYLHGADEYVKDPNKGYWYIDLRDASDGDEDVVYRCKVIPTERVR